jgi:hypothetical protein
MMSLELPSFELVLALYGIFSRSGNVMVFKPTSGTKVDVGCDYEPRYAPIAFEEP